VGDREAADGVVNNRLRTGEQKGEMSIDDIKTYIQDAINRKALI